MTHSEVLHATRDHKQWEHTSDKRVLPPRATKQPGRPKKNRIRIEDCGRQRWVVTCGNLRRGAITGKVVAIHHGKLEDAAAQVL